MKHRKLSTFLSAFILGALSLGVAALDGVMPPTARAQMQPPPLNGNIYQNQAAIAQQAQDGRENVMILLDSSYSMGESINGRGSGSKMIAAKTTVLDVLKTVSPNMRVGLRVYGNNANQISACRASNVLVPLGENNRNLISAKLLGVRPTGATPISYSVQRSLDEDFRNVSGKKLIILISDGIETCGEDPCNLAVRLQQMGANVKINVVGLGLQDYDAVKQLRCVALATKGNYYTANTAAELANSLSNALAVETRVQATIMVPKQQPVNTPDLSGQLPSSGQSGATQKPFEDKLLPAAVPIKSNSR